MQIKSTSDQTSARNDVSIHSAPGTEGPRSVVVGGANSSSSELYRKKMQQKAQADNNSLWQHPFVDVLKHFKLLPGSDWKLNKKAGDVQEYFVSSILYR